MHRSKSDGWTKPSRAKRKGSLVFVQLGLSDPIDLIIQIDVDQRLILGHELVRLKEYDENCQSDQSDG